MTALLSIARVHKRHGETTLFDLRDLVLDAASAYVLTGVNGAGKSTLLRVLAGLAQADVEGARFRRFSDAVDETGAPVAGTGHVERDLAGSRCSE